MKITSTTRSKNPLKMMLANFFGGHIMDFQLGGKRIVQCTMVTLYCTAYMVHFLNYCTVCCSRTTIVVVLSRGGCKYILFF